LCINKKNKKIKIREAGVGGKGLLKERSIKVDA